VKKINNKEATYFRWIHKNELAWTKQESNSASIPHYWIEIWRWSCRESTTPEKKSLPPIIEEIW